MSLRNCAHCAQTFTPCPQVPHQTYCSSVACQRARRRLWLQDRLRDDPDYRDNRARSQRAWLDRNPDYWKKYREARSLNGVRAEHLAAETDDSMQELMRGVYLLRLIGLPKPAKTDAWIVELSPLREAPMQSQRLQR